MNTHYMDINDTNLNELKQHIAACEYYPFSESGPLFPLLNDENLLYDFYSKANKRKDIKVFCKKIKWSQKPNLPRILNDDTLKPLIHSMCNSEDARKKLSKSQYDLDLYKIIWGWLIVEHIDIHEKIIEFCHQGKDNLYYISIDKLNELLKDKSLDELKNKRPLIFAALAFAMLQKGDRSEIGHEIVKKYPDTFDLFSSTNQETGELKKTVIENHTSHQKNAGVQADTDSSLEDNRLLAIGSIDDLVTYEESLEQLIIEFDNSSRNFSIEIEKLAGIDKYSDFIDSERIPKILLSLELYREQIKNKYGSIQQLLHLTCKKENFHKCEELSCFNIIKLSPNESIKKVIDKGNLQKNKIKDFIEKLKTAKIEIEDLKARELDLISSGDLKDNYFSFSSGDIFPCDLIQIAKQYRDHVSTLKSKVNNKLQKHKKELITKIDKLIENQELQVCNIYISELDKIKKKALSSHSLLDIKKLDITLNEVLVKNINMDEEHLQTIAQELEKNEYKPLDNILEICRILISNNKSSVAFLLLNTYQNINRNTGKSNLQNQAIEIIFDAAFNAPSDEIPLLTTFNELFNKPGIFNFVNGNIIQNELLERITIMLITAAAMGHVDSAFEIVPQINATEVSRQNLSEYLTDIIMAIVCQKTIKLASKDVLDKISYQEQTIYEKIAFEDGKYRHIQRGTKHFSRFESVCVYPALEELWGRILQQIKNENFIEAHNILDKISSASWYLELVDIYDKPLVDHIHYSTVTKKVIHGFLANIKEHLSYCENAFSKDQLVIMESRLIHELGKWSGNEPSRIIFIDKIKKLIQTETSSVHAKPFWLAITQCPKMILTCPNVVLWLQKQQSPSASEELIPLIINDLSHRFDLEKVEALYTRNSSWEPLSILFKSNDKERSSKYFLQFENHKNSLIEKSNRLLGLDGSPLFSYFNDCIIGGRLPAAYKILDQYHDELEAILAKERELTSLFVTVNLNLLNNIKDKASKSNMSDTWLDSIYNYSAKIEKNLRALERNDIKNEAVIFDKNKIGDALETLNQIVDTLSSNFDEVIHHLSSTYNNPVNENESNREIATQKCSELTTLWQQLSLSDVRSDNEVKQIWTRFVIVFSKISNLYHDNNDEKKRFGIPHSCSLKYTFPIYQTAFYKPKSEFLKRPVRLYLYQSNVDLGALKRLEDELSTEESASLLHIVFVPQELEKIQRFFRLDKSFKNFILVDEAFLYKVAAAERHDTPLRQALHVSVSDLANSSPFVSQGYCHQYNNIYVGRKDILQKLLNNPQAMIWGGRRIGKTSVLHALENALSRRNYKVAYVYVDIQDDGDPDLAIAQKIALTLELGSVKDITTFEKKVSNLRRSGTKVAFLIDEVDEYIKKSREVHNNDFPLATVLRQLVMDDSDKNTFLVYSGYHQLYYEAKLNQEKRRVGHPFINVTQQIPIRDLTYDDITELVKTGFEDMLGIQVNPSVPRRIAKRASRHPAFVQQFCRCLLEYVSNRRVPGTVVEITTKDVDAVYNANVSIEGGEQAFIHYFSETLGYNLSHLGHAILLAATDPEFTEKNIDDKYFFSKDILKLLNEWCSVLQIAEPKLEHFNQTIELLMMTNMLTQDQHVDGKYRATYPIHLDILKRLDKINTSAIEDALKEYDQKERDKGILL